MTRSSSRIANVILAYRQALPKGRGRGVGGRACQAGHARKKRESIGRKYKTTAGGYSTLLLAC